MIVNLAEWIDGAVGYTCRHCTYPQMDHSQPCICNHTAALRRAELLEELATLCADEAERCKFHVISERAEQHMRKLEILAALAKEDV